MTNSDPLSQSNNGVALPAPKVTLPVRGADFDRSDPALIEQLRGVSAATASADLHQLGIRQTYIEGPRPTVPGSKIVGNVVTLQFMPQREDVASGFGQEHIEKSSALWAVLEHVRPGDVLAIQAFGDPYTGCLGEMLITYFKARGGVGIVVDGYIRDWPRVEPIGLPIWTRGFTPNYASQSRLFPWAYNVPVALSNVLVLPGDLMIADGDGAVIIPRQLAPELAKHTLEHEDWEAFSRMRMKEGGALSRYYPLSDEGRQEYEAWQRAQQPK
jgi:regulator of RNase E activity RraA